MKGNTVTIGSKKIDEGNQVFIIAEAGVNHNGKLSLAKKLIDAAVSAGADAVKFQTFNPDTLVTKEAAKASYQRRNEKKRNIGETQYAMLKRLQLPREYHAPLKKYAEKKGIIFLSTPFSFSDAKFLKGLGVPALKISSSDANNLPYLRAIAKWKLPIILSTGMSDLSEIREAVAVIKKAGNTKLVLLHCTTNYPTPFIETNLRAIETLQKEFGLSVGFSDHTVENEAAAVAVALGAKVLEKHFTLDKELSGPDHKASLEPLELRAFIQRIRNVEKALGTGKKIPFKSEKKIARVARKSIVTCKLVKRGEVFTEENLGIKRPGTGLPPKYSESIIGTKATRDIPADTLIGERDYAKK